MTRVPPFLGEFSNEDAAWFIEVGFRRHVLAGEAIILEGEPVAELFVILKGSFSVASRQVQGMPYIRLEAGEIVGEMTFVDRDNLPLSSVRAEVDSDVLRIPRAALDEKLAADAEFRARFHTVVAKFTVHRLRESWRAPPPKSPPSSRVYDLIRKMLPPKDEEKEKGKRKRKAVDPEKGKKDGGKKDGGKENEDDDERKPPPG